MKQIYRFDESNPPPLTEKSLRAELARRTIRRQTVILALAGLIMNCCLILTAILLRPVNELLSISCMTYVITAICGSAVIAIVYDDKRRSFE